MAAVSPAEWITTSFYAWETRGRGWQLADYPVSLEPPYRPFFLLPGVLAPPESHDDGKRPTFLSSLVEGTKRLFVPAAPATAAPLPYAEEEPFPEAPRGPLSVLRISVPEEFDAKEVVATQLLLALSAATQPVSFELIGGGGKVALQIVCAEGDQGHVAESIIGYIPDASVVPDDDLLEANWIGRAERLVVDFGLSHEFFLPLASPSGRGIDPFIPLIPALARARRGEFVVLQVLFERVRNPWAKAIMEALSDGEGGSLFADAPEFLPSAKEKVKAPLFAVSLRVAAQAGREERAWELARGLHAFLLQFSRPGGNELVPLLNDGYDDGLHEVALLTRESYRTGMILGAEELVGLVHLPDRSVRHEALERERRRTKELPAEARGHSLILGENIHRGERVLATLGDEERLQHTWVIGASGTGKSTFLQNLIVEDIAEGKGIAVLDPHGDLVDDVLARVPEWNADRVIVFDPSDSEQPVGFNILSAGSAVERTLLASDLVGIFRRLSTSWGNVMTTVLGNAVLAILESPRGGTLVELRRFLVDDRFRSAYVATIDDAAIRFFWETEYPRIGARSVGPIISRLDALLRPRLLRYVVGQRASKLDLAKVMQSGKVFLAKLSQGLIGEENAYLLGSLLVSKFHQLALARQEMEQGDRDAFFLYADEFQHFVTPSMESLLAAARKYRLGLTLAHQTLAQLDGATKVGSALFGSAYTRVVFRVGDDDARKLANGFSFFDAADIERQGRGEAIVRVGSAANDFNLRTFPASVVDPEEGKARRAAIILHSRQTYGVPALELRRELDAAYRTVEAEPKKVTPAPSPNVHKEALLIEEEAVSPSESPRPATPPERAPAEQEEAHAGEPVTPKVPPLRTKRAAPRRPSVEPAPLGRGGQEHKYLQHLIKRLAEERGFRATIEEDAGDGKADVVLRKGTLTIACEVSITTNVEHEIENLKKCVQGGFSRILFVSPDKKRREKIAARLKDAGGAIPIDVLGPDDLVTAIDALEPTPTTTESTVRGYKVKVKRQNLSPDDMAGQRAAIAEVIAKSLGKEK